jgi:tetratricopeptide (TPR) repeat protein
MTVISGPGPDLTVEKRILLHLHKYSHTYLEAWEVPNAMSQEGISEALDILLNNVSRAMKDLKTDGKVTERLAHIKGGKRKRRAYFLTEEGVRLAEDIRKAVIDTEVPYIDKVGKSVRLSVGRVLGQFKLDFGNTLAPTDILETIRRNGVFDSVKVDASMKAAVAGEGKGATLVDMTDSAPRLAKFIGRAGILAQIEADLDTEGPGILVVHGMAGIGKTTLALKVMEDVRGTRNLFYYRFHTWDSLANVSSAIQELMFRMGLKTKAGPMSEMGINELAMLLARELGAQPVLLVFDDVHKAREDVISLFRVLADLSGQLSGLRLMLLTRTVPGFYSRKEVSVEKIVREVQLDGLDLEETKALLGDTMGQKVIERIHGLSKGVPLFLEILSGVDNVDAIEDVRKYIEEEIYSGLSPGERTILEGLSVHRYPVPPEAILAQGVTFDELSSLCRKSLVMELPHRRFEAHDLIKEFVYRRLSIEAKSNFHAKAAEFYRSPQIQDPDGALAENLYYSPGLAMLEAVHHMKRSGDVKGAATLLIKIGPDLLEGGHTEVRAILGSFDRSELDDGLWADILLVRGDAAAAAEDWPKALELYEDALAAKKALGADKATQAAIHGMIGMAQMHVERWEETVRSHENALKMFQESSDERGMAKELMHLGVVYRNRKDWKKAEASYEKARKLLEGLKDLDGQVVLHNNIAQLKMVKGDLKSAEIELKKALALADETGYDAGKAVALYTRGQLGWGLGRRSEARKDFDDATEIFRQKKDFDPAIRVQLALGDALLEREMPKEAKRAYLKALDMYQFKIGRGASIFSRSKTPEDLGTLGKIYDKAALACRALGEDKEALGFDIKAQDCFETIGDKTSLVKKLLDAGRTCEDLGDLKSARVDFEQALTAISDTDDALGQAAVHMNLARVLEATKDLQGATDHLMRARTLGRSSGDKELVRIVEKELRRIGPVSNEIKAKRK